MNTIRWLRHCVLAVALAVYGASACAAEPNAGSREEAQTQHKAKKAKAGGAPKINGLAQAAANAGVTDCVGRIHQIADFLTADSKSGAFLFLAPTDANRHILSSSFEIQADGASTYASASFAPVGLRGCGALYETVSYWSSPCDEVGARVFPSFSKAGLLGGKSGTISMLEKNPTMRVFLMPAGQGCISIKKEMIY